MPLSVYLTPARVSADIVAVIDVLRFTSSACYALAHGAQSIVPFATVEAAREYVAGWSREPGGAPMRPLLAGERNAQRPEGFDLGNSPREFTREMVQGRDVAWTTTNGTRAISPLISSDSCDVILASYVNLSAVARSLTPWVAGGAAVAIVCAGRDGDFALEDAACAGALVRALVVAVGGGMTMNDDAHASVCLDEAYGEDFPRLFRDAQHGRFLGAHGFGADLPLCAARDAVQVVPRLRSGRFVVG